MSLALLRDIRRSGMKPGVVMVYLANLPGWFDREDPRSIVIRPGDEPARMDWRALLNLPTAVFCRDECLSHFLPVLDAIQAAGGRLWGAATSFGVLPLTTEANEEHERLLRRAWEQLCKF
jgi:hypothetical protein